MGYYTHFLLDVEGDDLNFIDHETGIGEISGYGNPFDGSGIKWYDYQTDLIKYSHLFPNTLFIISGEGEHPGDMWRHYFKNGLQWWVGAEITFEEFNETKLK